ncbi:MAG: Mg2+/Co2+ transport protein [Bacteroidetes bacterium]|nr:MAG: Mg2+/Co2+ transport protein [Bacteroidota bacterium]
MVSKTTLGIRISVQTQYQDLYSRPEQRHFFFSYRITIENTTDVTVQLLRRHWFIFDSSFVHTEVEGEGVVGQQPVLEPGQSYSYESACNLTSDMGTMSGNYTMKRMPDGEEFDVRIPEFVLMASNRMN